MLLRKLLKEAIKNNDSYKQYIKSTILRNKNPYSSSIKKDFVLKVPNNIETKEQKLEWAINNLDQVKNPTIKEKFIANRNNPTTFDKNVIKDFDKLNPQSKLSAKELFLKNTYERGYDKDYNTLARKGYLEDIDPMSNYESYVQALEKGSDLLNKTIQKSKIINPVKVRRETDQFITNTGKTFKELKPGDVFEEKGFTSTSIPKDNEFKRPTFSSDYVMSIQLPEKQSFLNVGKSKSVEFPEEREILLPKGLKYRLENITPEGVREFSIVNPYSLGLLAAAGAGVSQMKKGSRLKFKNGGPLKHSNKALEPFKIDFNSKPLKDVKEAYNPFLKLKSGGSLKDSMSCGQVKKSTRPGKKIMKLYCIDGKRKLVHAGAVGYSDFTKHKDPKRKKNFHSRHNCKEAKPGTPKHLACTELW